MARKGICLNSLNLVLISKEINALPLEILHISFLGCRYFVVIRNTITPLHILNA